MGTDRMLRAKAREADPSSEEWAARLRAHWRSADGAAAERIEGRLRCGASLGWAPASALLGAEGQAVATFDRLEAALEALVADPELALAIWRALAASALDRWGRGSSGEAGARALAGFELAPEARRALADEATMIGVRARPPGAQRTGEISPSGRAAALAGLVLGLSLSEDPRVELEGCFQLVAGMLGPEEVLHVARGVLPLLLQAELDLGE